jgi:hypothetical protein
MSTSEKLELDYKSFIENIEQVAAADIQKIRADLDTLKKKAAQFDIAA